MCKQSLMTSLLSTDWGKKGDCQLIKLFKQNLMTIKYGLQGEGKLIVNQNVHTKFNVQFIMYGCGEKGDCQFIKIVQNLMTSLLSVDYGEKGGY